VIDRFMGEHRWLSNFWSCTVSHDGRVYRSVEHAYQALKATTTADHDLVMNAMTPGQAKKLGKKVRIRDDWDQVKDAVMLSLVRAKFSQNPDLREKLAATGDTELVEGNSWGDVYWGTDLKTGVGQNKLGKMLMVVREEQRGER
jgi:hypothetical protein